MQSSQNTFSVVNWWDINVISRIHGRKGIFHSGFFWTKSQKTSQQNQPCRCHSRYKLFLPFAYRSSSMTSQISVSSFDFNFHRQTSSCSSYYAKQREFYFRADFLPIPDSICWTFKRVKRSAEPQNRDINQKQTVVSLKDRVGERERKVRLKL